jgi:hypothetical protein
MLVAAVSLLAAAADPAADRALLQAFEAPCRHVRDFAKIKAGALAGGWAEIAEDADPRVARLSKLGRDEVGSEGKLYGATYRRSHAGRAVFLIVSRFEDKDGVWGNGCRVYDFDASEAIAPETAEAWIGKPPTGTQVVPGGTKHLWEPWVSGQSFELNYMPAGGEVEQRFGLRGVILVAQAIGGF